MVKKLTYAQLIDRVIVVVGASLLLLLVAGSWFPRRCPEIKMLLVGCPLAFIPNSNFSGDPELMRFGHEDIATQDEYVDASSEPTRDRTKINFYYKASIPNQSIYLKMKVDGKFTTVGTVTHPLLTALQWSSVTDAQTSLFTRNAEVSSIESLLTNVPLKSELVVDASSADRYHLDSKQFTPLEGLENLDGVNYIITTYHKPTMNGSWSNYSYVINAISADVTIKNKISFELSTDPSSTVKNPLHMGILHVNYLLSNAKL